MTKEQPRAIMRVSTRLLESEIFGANEWITILGVDPNHCSHDTIALIIESNKIPEGAEAVVCIIEEKARSVSFETCSL